MTGTSSSSVDKAIRLNRRAGWLTLGFVALMLGLAVVTGDRPSGLTTIMPVMLTLLGLGELFSAHTLRLDRDDPAGIERRSRRWEAIVVFVGVGLPMLALLVVLGYGVVVLLS